METAAKLIQRHINKRRFPPFCAARCTFEGCLYDKKRFSYKNHYGIAKVTKNDVVYLAAPFAKL
jgi:hypothetical protein